MRRASRESENHESQMCWAQQNHRRRQTHTSSLSLKRNFRTSNLLLFIWFIGVLVIVNRFFFLWANWLVFDVCTHTHTSRQWPVNVHMLITFWCGFHFILDPPWNHFIASKSFSNVFLLHFPSNFFLVSVLSTAKCVECVIFADKVVNSTRKSKWIHSLRKNRLKSCWN